MFEQTKALCDHFLELGIPGCDLMVCKDGKTVLRYLGGYADPDKKIPITGKEKYHMYSCSKLFTCAAAMQLWEKGMFSLEDRLSDYMPAFREMTVKTKDGVRKAEKPILIRHLFTMTSGMNYDLHTPELDGYYERCGYCCSTYDLVQQFAKTPLEFEPGESWLYGLSHDVLAALVEQLSGQKFEDYVREHIFKPLGMEHSDFLHPVEDWEGFARQYRYDSATGQFQPWWDNTYRPVRGYASGGAGCVSTVEDFSRFLEALRTGSILKKETAAMMATDRLTDRQREMYNFGTEDIGYGLGMRAPRAGSSRTEFGWGGAAGAYAAVDVVNDITIYYAQHVLSSPNKPLRHSLYDAVLADLKGEKLQLHLPNKPDDPTITY